MVILLGKLFILISSFFNVIQALTCYSCGTRDEISAINNEVEERMKRFDSCDTLEKSHLWPSSSFLVHCDEGMVCAKIVTFDSHGHLKSTKGCAAPVDRSGFHVPLRCSSLSSYSNDSEQEQEEIMRKEEHTCFCNHNYCNSSSHLHWHIPLFIFIFIGKFFIPFIINL